jgi:translation elongation factor EF-Tu-like GTPase
VSTNSALRGIRTKLTIVLCSKTDGTCHLRADTEMVNPGDYASFAVTLNTAVAVEPGVHFAVQDGARTVAAGVVTAVCS